jgi:hypothetical protein
MVSDETFRTIVVAFITGLPATIAAIGAAAAAIFGLLQSRKNGAKVDANTVLTQQAATVTDSIHVNTNGRLTELKERLAAAECENEALKTAALK